MKAVSVSVCVCVCGGGGGGVGGIAWYKCVYIFHVRSLVQCRLRSQSCSLHVPACDILLCVLLGCGELCVCV